MTDRILDTFLRRQMDEGLELAGASDFLTLMPLGDCGDRYLVAFNCKGLVREAPGRVVEAEHFELAIWFPESYLRSVDPFRVLTWMGPRNVWHPNISNDAPLICVGRLAPGTGLVDLLYQAFEIITWNKVTMREDDALNKAACQWARSNLNRLPVDGRPLKRRVLNFDVETCSRPEQQS